MLVELNDCTISNLASSCATSKLLLKRFEELPEVILFEEPKALFLCCCCCCCKSCIRFNAAIFVNEEEETDLLSWCWTDKFFDEDGPEVFRGLGVCCELLLLLFIRQIDEDVREKGGALRRFGGVVSFRPVYMEVFYQYLIIW